MTSLDYVKRFPVSVNQYGIISASELQLLIWTATLPAGIRKSNSQLAEILCTNRRMIIRAINRLRDKKLIINIGTKYHRVLVASSDVLSLFEQLNSDELSPFSDSNGDKLSQNSDKSVTHKLNNLNNTTTYTKLSFHLRGNGDLWHLSEEQFNSYLKTYTSLDVESELRKAAQWLFDNPQKRKTERGMGRFLNGWLNRAKPKPELKRGDIDWLPTEDEADKLFEEIKK